MANQRPNILDHPDSDVELLFERDGSSCLEMATSLRKLLSLEFSSAAGVHIAPQSREDFRRNINCNWNWLDGKSLL